VVLTVRTEVPEALGTDAGLNEHVGPRVADGATLQVKATAVVKPLSGATVMVEVEVAPAAIVAGVNAVAAIVKSGVGGGTVTVKPTVASWLKDWKVPVTVTVEVANGVAAVVETVITEVTVAACGVTDDGLNEQLAPRGSPEQVRVTALRKLLAAGATETV
jgi:hypothetical protein